MAVILSPIGGAAAQFFDNNGVPLAGGLIYTYLAGTNTPKATYTTSAGNIAHSNPIVLDSAGRVPTGEIWLSFSTSYKFVIRDSTGALIGTYDNINGVNAGVNVQNYTGTGSTTTFALPVGVTTVYNIFINGVYQNKNTYSVSSGNIVFTQAPPYTSIIEAQV
jgi:hypothetical protein